MAANGNFVMRDSTVSGNSLLSGTFSSSNVTFVGVTFNLPACAGTVVSFHSSATITDSSFNFVECTFTLTAATSQKCVAFEHNKGAADNTLFHFSRTTFTMSSVQSHPLAAFESRSSLVGVVLFSSCTVTLSGNNAVKQHLIIVTTPVAGAYSTFAVEDSTLTATVAGADLASRVEAVFLDSPEANDIVFRVLRTTATLAGPGEAHLFAVKRFKPLSANATLELEDSTVNITAPKCNCVHSSYGSANLLIGVRGSTVIVTSDSTDNSGLVTIQGNMLAKPGSVVIEGSTVNITGNGGKLHLVKHQEAVPQRFDVTITGTVANIEGGEEPRMVAVNLPVTATPAGTFAIRRSTLRIIRASNTASSAAIVFLGNDATLMTVILEHNTLQLHGLPGATCYVVKFQRTIASVTAIIRANTITVPYSPTNGIALVNLYNTWGALTFELSDNTITSSESTNTKLIRNSGPTSGTPSRVLLGACAFGSVRPNSFNNALPTSAAFETAVWNLADPCVANELTNGDFEDADLNAWARGEVPAGATKGRFTLDSTPYPGAVGQYAKAPDTKTMLQARTMDTSHMEVYFSVGRTSSDIVNALAGFAYLTTNTVVIPDNLAPDSLISTVVAVKRFFKPYASEVGMIHVRCSMKPSGNNQPIGIFSREREHVFDNVAVLKTTAAMVAAPVFDPALNLVVNPSFEDDADGSTTVTGFTTEAGQPRVKGSSDPGTDGSKVLTTNNAQTEAVVVQDIDIASHSADIDEGRAQAYLAFRFATPLSNPGGGIALRCKAEYGTVVGIFEMEFGGANGIGEPLVWVEVDPGSLRLPRLTRTLQLAITLRRSSGETSTIDAVHVHVAHNPALSVRYPTESTLPGGTFNSVTGWTTTGTVVSTNTPAWAGSLGSSYALLSAASSVWRSFKLPTGAELEYYEVYATIGRDPVALTGTVVVTLETPGGTAVANLTAQPTAGIEGSYATDVTFSVPKALLPGPDAALRVACDIGCTLDRVSVKGNSGLVSTSATSNQLTNGGFESSLSGYTVVDGAPVAMASTAANVRGGNALQLLSSEANGPARVITDAVDLTAMGADIDQGRVRFDFSVLVLPVGRTLTFDIIFLSSTSTEFARYNMSFTHLDPSSPDAFVRLRIRKTESILPWGTRHVKVQAGTAVSGSTGADSPSIDDLQFHVATDTAVHPYPPSYTWATTIRLVSVSYGPVRLANVAFRSASEEAVIASSPADLVGPCTDRDRSTHCQSFSGTLELSTRPGVAMTSITLSPTDLYDGVLVLTLLNHHGLEIPSGGVMTFSNGGDEMAMAVPPAVSSAAPVIKRIDIRPFTASAPVLLGVSAWSQDRQNRVTGGTVACQGLACSNAANCVGLSTCSIPFHTEPGEVSLLVTPLTETNIEVVELQLNADEAQRRLMMTAVIETRNAANGISGRFMIDATRGARVALAMPLPIHDLSQPLPAPVKYVRIIRDNPSITMDFRVNEIELYAASSTNVLLGRPVTAESTANVPALSHCTDGNSGTHCVTTNGETRHVLQVELSVATTDVRAIRVLATNTDNLRNASVQLLTAEGDVVVDEPCNDYESSQVFMKPWSHQSFTRRMTPTNAQAAPPTATSSVAATSSATQPLTATKSLGSTTSITSALTGSYTPSISGAPTLSQEMLKTMSASHMASHTATLIESKTVGRSVSPTLSLPVFPTGPLLQNGAGGTVAGATLGGATWAHPPLNGDARAWVQTAARAFETGPGGFARARATVDTSSYAATIAAVADSADDAVHAVAVIYFAALANSPRFPRWVNVTAAAHASITDAAAGTLDLTSTTAAAAPWPSFRDSRRRASVAVRLPLPGGTNAVALTIDLSGFVTVTGVSWRFAKGIAPDDVFGRLVEPRPWADISTVDPVRSAAEAVPSPLTFPTEAPLDGWTMAPAGSFSPLTAASEFKEGTHVAQCSSSPGTWTMTRQVDVPSDFHGNVDVGTARFTVGALASPSRGGASIQFTALPSGDTTTIQLPTHHDTPDSRLSWVGLPEVALPPGTRQIALVVSGTTLTSSCAYFDAFFVGFRGELADRTDGVATYTTDTTAADGNAIRDDGETWLWPSDTQWRAGGADAATATHPRWQRSTESVRGRSGTRVFKNPQAVASDGLGGRDATGYVTLSLAHLAETIDQDILDFDLSVSYASLTTPSTYATPIAAVAVAVGLKSEGVGWPGFDDVLPPTSLECTSGGYMRTWRVVGRVTPLTRSVRLELTLGAGAVADDVSLQFSKRTAPFDDPVAIAPGDNLLQGSGAEAGLSAWPTSLGSARVAAATLASVFPQGQVGLLRPSREAAKHFVAGANVFEVCAAPYEAQQVLSLASHSVAIDARRCLVSLGFRVLAPAGKFTVRVAATGCSEGTEPSRCGGHVVASSSFTVASPTTPNPAPSPSRLIPSGEVLSPTIHFLSGVAPLPKTARSLLVTLTAASPVSSPACLLFDELSLAAVDQDVTATMTVLQPRLRVAEMQTLYQHVMRKRFVLADPVGFPTAFKNNATFRAIVQREVTDEIAAFLGDGAGVWSEAWPPLV